VNALLTKLSQFVGYGSKDAKVIFIGTEEYTYDDNDRLYEKRLRIQRDLEPFEDLGKFCARLSKNPRLYNPQKSWPQATWAPLCSVMLGLDGKFERMGNKGEIIKYQSTKLGRFSGDNLLAELLPVPKSGAAVFNRIHRELLGFSDRADIHEYRREVLPHRKVMLAKMLKERFSEGRKFRPRLIVGYGRPWSDVEEIFEGIGQVDYDESDIRFKWARMEGCLFMLTFHPKCQDNRRFGTAVAKRIVEIYLSTAR
jgi:hypothetical protein